MSATDEAALAAIVAEGARLWNERRFFECHDKLEEAWRALKQEKKAEPPKDARRDFVHGIILLAAAYVHWQRGNAIGIQRMVDDAERLLRGALPGHFGISTRHLRDTVYEDLRRGIAGERFDPARSPRLTG